MAIGKFRIILKDGGREMLHILNGEREYYHNSHALKK